MSQYIANLNTDTPPTEDLFAGAQDDLSLFASTEFFDWDMNFDASESGNFETNTVDKKPSTAGWQPSTGTSGNQFSLDGESYNFLFAASSRFSPLFSFLLSIFLQSVFINSHEADAHLTPLNAQTYPHSP